MTYRQIFFACSLVIGSSVSHAQMYKWTDEHGQTHYSNEAPPKQPNHKEFTITDNISSFSGTAVPLNPRVTMYSTSWCGYCKKARKYFRKNGISFREKDIEKSASAKREFDKHGKGGGIPLILIGKKKMRGFSQARFSNLYK